MPLLSLVLYNWSCTVEDESLAESFLTPSLNHWTSPWPQNPCKQITSPGTAITHPQNCILYLLGVFTLRNFLTEGFHPFPFKRPVKRLIKYAYCPEMVDAFTDQVLAHPCILERSNANIMDGIVPPPPQSPSGWRSCQVSQDYATQFEEDRPQPLKNSRPILIKP